MPHDDLAAIRGIIWNTLLGLGFWAAILVPIVLFYP